MLVSGALLLTPFVGTVVVVHEVLKGGVLHWPDSFAAYVGLFISMVMTQVCVTKYWRLRTVARRHRC